MGKMRPITCTSPNCECDFQPGSTCRARSYMDQRTEIESRQPYGWDMSSFIAFESFHEQKAAELRALDERYGFRIPSLWERFRRWWG